MKIIFKDVYEDPRQMVVPNELKVLQNLVGGYIETVTLFEDMTIICNEEGRINGQMYNCEICGIEFYGPIVLVGIKGDEFADVPITVVDVGRLLDNCA